MNAEIHNELLLLLSVADQGLGRGKVMAGNITYDLAQLQAWYRAMTDPAGNDAYSPFFTLGPFKQKKMGVVVTPPSKDLGYDAH